VQNLESLSFYDFRRLFKILNLREELAPLFKTLLEIAPDEKIGKKTIPVTKFI